MIYDYYKCHILFGQLHQGDLLPTIEQIGNTFQVAPQTVRNALKKLQQDNLIFVSPGRHTEVIYKTTPSEALQYTQNYYLARKDEINVVYHIAVLLLTPFFYAGCQKLTDNDLMQILRVCREKGSNIVSISMFCCEIMLRAVDNQLINTLFSDVVSFFQFPCMASFSEESSLEYQEYYNMTVSSCEALDRAGLFQAFAGFQALTQTTLLAFITEAAKTTPKPKQISFHWQTYRDRPQHCHTLAAKMIYGIISGQYWEGKMLPSYENLALELSVSVSTVRRTVSLLRDMGLIYSMNGVGNRIVFSPPNYEKLQRPTIQKNIVMARESAEILLVVFKNVVDREFSKLTNEHIQEMKKILSDKKNCCVLDVAILLMDYLMVLYPLSSFFETFGKLSGFLLLSYPFLLDQWRKEGSGEISGTIEVMNRALDEKNTDLFSDGMSALLQYVLTQIKQTEKLLYSAECK
nr:MULTISPECIES: GntR family transcriptional regulator [Lachnospiraceae]